MERVWTRSVDIDGKKHTVKFSVYDEREFLGIGIPMGQATTDAGEWIIVDWNFFVLNIKMQDDHLVPVLEIFLSILHNDDPPNQKLLGYPRKGRGWLHL